MGMLLTDYDSNIIYICIVLPSEYLSWSLVIYIFLHYVLCKFNWIFEFFELSVQISKLQNLFIRLLGRIYKFSLAKLHVNMAKSSRPIISPNFRGIWVQKTEFRKNLNLTQNCNFQNIRLLQNMRIWTNPLRPNDNLTWLNAPQL